MPSTRPTRASVPSGSRELIEDGRRRHGHARRRAVEPVPARARPRPRRSCERGIQVGDRRLPRLRHDLRCSTATTRTSSGRRRWASRSSPARPRGGSTKCCSDAMRGHAQAALQLHERPADIEGTPIPYHCLRAVAHRRRQRRASTPAAAARSSARSARSSTCRAASRAAARRTTSSRSSARTSRQGLHSFFITDDNFARNKDWEAILDRLIQLRRGRGDQDPASSSRWTRSATSIPSFIEKCARAGVRRVFIGLENINPDSLVGAKKRQNKITEYRKMLLAWKNAGVITYAGYILGFPERHAGVDPATTSRSSSASCRSTSWSSSSSRRCRAPRITRSCTRPASRWIRT